MAKRRKPQKVDLDLSSFPAFQLDEFTREFMEEIRPEVVIPNAAIEGLGVLISSVDRAAGVVTVSHYFGLKCLEHRGEPVESGEEDPEKINWGDEDLQIAWRNRHEFDRLQAAFTSRFFGFSDLLGGWVAWAMRHKDCRAALVSEYGHVPPVELPDGDAIPEDPEGAVVLATRALHASFAVEQADKASTMLDRLVTLWRAVGKPEGSPLIDVLSATAQQRAEDLLRQSLGKLRLTRSRTNLAPDDHALLFTILREAIQGGFKIPKPGEARR